MKLGHVLKVVGEALQAVDQLGFPAWNVRLAACQTLLSGFARYYRRTPEEVEALLRQVIPPSVFDEDRMKAEEVYKAARGEYWRIPAWHPVRGLYVRALPRSLVAPWESYERVVKVEAPKSKELEKLEHRLKRTSDDEYHRPRAILEHPSAGPLLLEAEEPLGDTRFEDTDALPY